MPSRKKAKGKARKAAKKAKAKEEERRAEGGVADSQLEEDSLEPLLNLSVEDMLRQLVIDERRQLIDETTQRECEHGLIDLSAGEEKIFLEFIDAYIASFFSYSQEDVVEGFFAAHHATKDKYFDVYSSKLDEVISIILNNGTQDILEGDNEIAQLYASLACYFEEWIAVNVHKNQATFRWAKVVELESADDHTLVSYYRKRIPCACLDEKYKEVKSVKKMGLCYNSNCSHPEERVERSKMFCCTRCGDANYCSVECQKADWKEHRVQCEEDAKKIAAFDSKES